MRAKLFFFVLCLIFTILCSCNVQTENREVPSDSAASGSDLYVNIPLLNKEKQKVYHIAWGNFSATPGRESVIVFSDIPSDSQRQVEVFLLVDLNEGHAVCSLDLFDAHVIDSGDVYAADLDRDGADEIVYSGEVTGNGGILVRVYKISDGQFQLLYDFDADDAYFGDRFGYTFSYLTGKRLSVQNESFGYLAEQDLAPLFDETAFGEDGILIPSRPIYLGTTDARAVISTDINGDAVLKYMQYAVGDTVYGCTITTLKFDTEQRNFVPIAAEYVPMGYFGWGKLLKESDYISVVD